MGRQVNLHVDWFSEFQKELLGFHGFVGSGNLSHGNFPLVKCKPCS